MKEKYAAHLCIIPLVTVACLKLPLAMCQTFAYIHNPVNAAVLGRCMAVHANYMDPGSPWWHISAAHWELSGDSCGHVDAL